MQSSKTAPALELSTSPRIDAKQVTASICVDVVGGDMRRLFIVWNRGYKTMCICASDVHEALHLAVGYKHLKKAAAYRRFEDVTDRALTAEAIEFGPTEVVQALLDHGKSGCAVYANGVWKLDGEVIPTAE